LEAEKGCKIRKKIKSKKSTLRESVSNRGVLVAKTIEGGQVPEDDEKPSSLNSTEESKIARRCNVARGNIVVASDNGISLEKKDEER